MLSDPAVYGLALVAALCIGLSKAGFSGISMVSVFLLADLYGAKASVGLALPLLIVADILAYPAFMRHGSWRPVWKLLIPTVIGLLVGWWMLGATSDQNVRRVIGGCILLMVSLQAFRQLRPAWFIGLAEAQFFGIAAGVLGGWATMLANAAGPVIQLYLLARKLPKMELIGISVRFFLLVNLLKVPLNARLALITAESLMENLTLLPGVVVGLVGGRWLVRHVPQRAFEWLVVIFSVIAGLRLLLW